MPAVCAHLFHSYRYTKKARVETENFKNPGIFFYEWPMLRGSGCGRWAFEKMPGPVCGTRVAWSAGQSWRIRQSLGLGQFPKAGPGTARTEPEYRFSARS